MQLVLDDRKLHISPLRIVMPGGHVEAEYFSLESESGAEAKLDLQIKSLNCLAAPFNIENGVMKSKKILLDSTDVIVNGRGSIDFVDRELDLLFAPQAKLEKFLSVTSPIKVEGPFSDFQAGVTTSGLAINAFKCYMSLIYVPFKWLTGERFPADGQTTCFNAMDWEVPEQGHMPEGG